MVRWKRMAAALALATVVGCGGKATEVDTAVVTPDPSVPAPRSDAKAPATAKDATQPK